MSNRKTLILMALFGLFFGLVLTACGGTAAVEEAVQEAADTAEEAVTDVVEEAEEVMEEVAEEAEEVMEEAEEVMEEAEEAVEEVMEEEMAEPDYDTDLYGVIDDIDLDGTTVTFWTRYDSGGRQEAMDQICADFNATNEYGITVECIALGHYGILYDSMIAGMTTGEVPGLIVAYQNQAAAYQVADGLVSADPYINHPVYGLGDEAEDYFQSFIDSDRLPQFGNQTFGFPAAGRSMEVLFANTDWLAELGYDAPPQTPEEFAEMACAAAATPFSKNASDFTTGMEVSTDASAVAAWVFARGGDVFDSEAGVFTYNTPEAVEALTLMQNLYADGCIAQIAERFGDQTDFGNGKTLFTTSSTSGLPFYVGAVSDGEAGGFEWTVAPIPYTGSDPVTNIYGASTSIVRTDPATQLASWLFLKYWSEPENQSVWAQSSNYFPARASVADDLSDYFQENEAYGTSFEWLKYGKAEPPVAGYDNVRDVVEEAAIAIIFDGADIESTLADLDVQANEILAESAP
jgi:ABC-type glycerol-3-phosphate transport system substrate-binding protein